MAQVARDSKTFKHYHTALRSQLTTKQLSTFENFKSNEEKIIFIHDLNLPTPVVKKQLNIGKCNEEAAKFKHRGNVCFAEKNYIEAFRCYSQSILKYLPNSESSEEISIYYANRSAALYHLKEYDLAIDDVDFALSHHYPKHLLHKILDRKARCLLALEKYQQACEVFKRTIQALDDAKIPLDKRQKWQKDVQIMLIMMSKNKLANGKSSSKSDVKIKRKTNPIYEAISSNVEINYSDCMGRFAEAKQDIPIGEVVLVEDAHSAVLLQKYQHTNCYHCFRRVKALHACPSCDLVIFCSLSCMNTAMTYHRVECSVLAVIWESQISVTCHISFRIIAQHPLEYFLKRKNHLNNTSSKEFHRYRSHDYETIYNLVDHEEKRKPEDILNRIHVALFLLKCLKEGGYFQQKETCEKLTEDEIFIGKLLLHHLQVSQFNSHEVYELHVTNNSLVSSTSEFIGGAIYPTLALFNHSCNPGVIRYFDGTKVIVRTIRSIKAGEMVAENYGPIFTQTCREERQRILKEQYWFDCNCEACTNNWPTMSQMLNEKCMKFRCANKKCQSAIIVDPNSDGFVIKCRKCSQSNNILKALKSLQETEEKFKMARTLVELKKFDEALEATLTIQRLLETILVPPFKEYYLCAQIIRTCFLSKGNIYLKSGQDM